jgi:hypothetical protein
MLSKFVILFLSFWIFFLFSLFLPKFFFFPKNVKTFFNLKRHAIYDKILLFWGWNCVKFHTEENADPVCSIKWSNQLEPMGITKLQEPAHVRLILDVEHLKKFHVFLFHESSAFHTWKFVHKISSIKLHPFLHWKFMNGILDDFSCTKKEEKKKKWMNHISWMKYISRLYFLNDLYFILRFHEFS